MLDGGKRNRKRLGSTVQHLGTGTQLLSAEEVPARRGQSCNSELLNRVRRRVHRERHLLFGDDRHERCEAYRTGRVCTKKQAHRTTSKPPGITARVQGEGANLLRLVQSSPSPSASVTMRRTSQEGCGRCAEMRYVRHYASTSGHVWDSRTAFLSGSGETYWQLTSQQRRRQSDCIAHTQRALTVRH